MVDFDDLEAFRFEGKGTPDTCWAVALDDVAAGEKGAFEIHRNPECKGCGICKPETQVECHWSTPGAGAFVMLRSKPADAGVPDEAIPRVQAMLLERAYTSPV